MNKTYLVGRERSPTDRCNVTFQQHRLANVYPNIDEAIETASSLARDRGHGYIVYESVKLVRPERSPVIVTDINETA